MILGIDPALASMGYALLSDDGVSLRDYGVITTSSKDLLSSRLASIHTDISELVRKYRPQTIAIEKPFFRGQKTNAHQVQFAIGVILLAIHDAGGVTPLWVNTAQVKTAVGCKGNAGKLEVKAAVQQQFGLEGRGADDAFDAVAIAYAASIGNVIQEKTA